MRPMTAIESDCGGGTLVAGTCAEPGFCNRECLRMCDYSLQNVKSRAANVGDKLTTKNFGAGTRGFAAPEDSGTAVCILPGTELAFADEIVIALPGMFEGDVKRTGFTTAIFRQVDKELPYRHHDAVEFPNGDTVL